MDLADLSASELARRIQAAEITSTDVVEACIRRIENREGEINAWIHFDPEFARAQAARCDQRQASGAPIGPLHGIPVGIKDIFDTKDLPTENGTVLDAGRQPTRDCSAVSQLKAAGAVIMGKTVSTEMAVYSPGKTANPRDIKRTPGGSSSGSAAAVGCGMVPLAIGSQTNGSVIRPAAFCGVVGYKPTHGRISRTGGLMLSRELDHIGVFARSVEDAALIAENLMNFDSNDPDSQPMAAPQLSAIAHQPLAIEPKIAFVKTPEWDKADPATQKAFSKLASDLGANCTEVATPPEFDAAVDHLKNIMHADLARYLKPYVERGADKISDILIGMIEDGQTVSALDYNSSLDQRQPMNEWLSHLCNDYDAIMTPAAIGEAPLGLEATGDPVFCSTWTFLGVPAVTLPILKGDNGMPLGVQLIRKKGGDGQLLRTARWLAGKFS